MSEGTIRCRSCRSEIPADASKCSNCGSHQDWRRFLTFSSTVLSLLVAFTSLVALIITQLKLAVPPDSRVEIFLIREPYRTTVFADEMRERAGLMTMRSGRQRAAPGPTSRSRTRRPRARGNPPPGTSSDPGVPHIAFEIMGVNSGSRPALLEGVRVLLDGEWKEATLYSESGTTDFFSGSELLAPGDTGHYAAKVKGTKLPTKFELEASVVNFRGSRIDVAVIRPTERSAERIAPATSPTEVEPRPTSASDPAQPADANWRDAHEAAIAMDESDVGARVVDLIASQLGTRPDELEPSTRLVEDLGADSLDTVELVMKLEAAFGFEVPDAEAPNLTTVADTVRYVESRLPAPQPDPLAR